ncbi:hypothetical protein EOA37_23080 [Mesorhizobium sp. M2A.F.Ca.ET.015.02.1.1]|nr:hypothetical protein EOA37_23080 [Mesorhizobium sp. M2A.F.Ca.ET.015.02.1.1]
MNTPQVWDRHAISAEIRRRGMTLTGIAKDAGLYASACRQGLFGLSRPGAQAIADALDIPFRTLFPDQYPRGRHNEVETTSAAGESGSAKVALNLDASPGAP